jgi:hypothetical protein
VQQNDCTIVHDMLKFSNLNRKENVKMTRTSKLFSTPGFFRGMAATLDMGNTLMIYNRSKTSEEADYKAIQSDWFAVGDDISFAMETWEREYVKK